MDITFLTHSASVSRVRPEYVTQESEDTGSYDCSDASSIARFPAFHFSLHGLTSLAALLPQGEATRASHVHKGSRKVHLLVAVLEIEGPESIRLKKGPDAGKEVSLLKLVLGDESGGICKLSAWRDVAEDWAGLNSDTRASVQAVKKGDIVFLESTWLMVPGRVTHTHSPAPGCAPTFLQYSTRHPSHMGTRLGQDCGRRTNHLFCIASVEVETASLLSCHAIGPSGRSFPSRPSPRTQRRSRPPGCLTGRLVRAHGWALLRRLLRPVKAAVNVATRATPSCDLSHEEPTSTYPSRDATGAM